MNQSAKWFRVSGPALFLLALFIIEISVFGSSGQRRGSAAKARGAQQIADLFRNNCARCHGADGRADTPLGHTYNTPDLTNDEWWRTHTDITGTRRLVSIVSHGKGGMPAFGKKLRRNEITLLVSYVRRFRRQK
jgi:mono/diheme cytochrome c family protein